MPAGELRISGSRARPGRLRLAGELDVATRDMLLAVGSGPDRRARDLRVDASALAFIDCAGLAALVELARAARAEGLAFESTSASGSRARLSALTGMDDVLGVVSTPAL